MYRSALAIRSFEGGDIDDTDGNSVHVGDSLVSGYLLFFIFSEYWLGLDEMNEYTKSGNWKLKVEIKYDVLRNGAPSTRAGTWGVGEWDNFAVASEANKYRLTIGSRTENDNMGSRDPFQYGRHNSKSFSTEEDGRDNDEWNCCSCASDRKGGWWFHDCAEVCLNCKKKGIWFDGSRWEMPSRSLMWIMKTD